MIQQYVAETLTASQIEDVERKMSTDAEFKAAVEEYKRIAASIKISEKKQLKERLQSLEKEPTSKGSSFKIWRIAASIALLIGLGSLYIYQTSNSTESLYASNFEPYPNTLQPIVRNVPGNSAFIAYEAGNYEAAIKEFELLLKNEDNMDIQFYLAMSFLNNNNIGKALHTLNTLVNTDTRYLAQVHWYRALAHLKNDDKSLALQSLKDLKDTDASYKKKQRESIMDNLD